MCYNRPQYDRGAEYMDLQFLLRHLISGCISVMPAVVLYFFFLHLIRRKQTIGHTITAFVFCFYLIGLWAATGICVKAAFSPNIVYIPFVDMLRGPVDTVLNIILFVPMGLFLPILYEKYDKLGKIALLGFLLSLSVEIVQLFGFGATDINDLITNTVGACLGYGLYKQLVKAIPASTIEQIRVEGSQCYYELLFFWICSLVLMITIQPQICRALFY